MGVLRKRFAAAAVVAAVSLATWSGGAAPASAAGCTTKFTTYSTVKAGTKGKKAGAVECLLRQAGFTASANRSFSKSDAKKLKAFQTARSLKATGKTNASTWAALIAQGSTPALERGDTGSSVRRLQLSLRALGHDELPGTTTYGKLTEQAVKDLQTSVGLTATGSVGDAEWAALQAGGQAVAPEPGGGGTGTGGGSGGGSGSGGGTQTETPGQVALDFAKAQLGEPYKFGAAGPSKWDCSGLTMRAWEKAGVKLPHSAAAQYKLGTKVKKADLQPGDLVFFYSGPSHVGIYVGDGQVIHAPKPGSKVSYIKMAYMPWKGARRPG